MTPSPLFFFLCSYPSPSSPHLSFQKACPEGRRSLRREERLGISCCDAPTTPLLYSPKHTTKVGFFGKNILLSPPPLCLCLSACQGPKNVGPPPHGTSPLFGWGGGVSQKKNQNQNQIEKEKERELAFPPIAPPLFLITG